jgi:hypothetical protein
MQFSPFLSHTGNLDPTPPPSRQLNAPSAHISYDYTPYAPLGQFKDIAKLTFFIYVYPLKHG